MYRIIMLIALSCLLLLSSCDPDDKDIFNPEIVKINGTFNNVSESITLGETIKLDVVLPDTLISNGRSYFIQSLQIAEFQMGISKIDTVSTRSVLLYPPTYFANPGSISSTNSFFISLNTSIKPFRVTIELKPLEKGIYVFNVTSQPGKLKANNSFEPRLVVGFDVPNKHTNLAERYFGTAWADDAITRAAGTYVFRVN